MRTQENTRGTRNKLSRRQKIAVAVALAMATAGIAKATGEIRQSSETDAKITGISRLLGPTTRKSFYDQDSPFMALTDAGVDISAIVKTRNPLTDPEAVALAERFGTTVEKEAVNVLVNNALAETAGHDYPGLTPRTELSHTTAAAASLCATFLVKTASQVNASLPQRELAVKYFDGATGVTPPTSHDGPEADAHLAMVTCAAGVVDAAKRPNNTFVAN